ncbi:probable receptor-like protein kinase At2g23200 isoform X3 [Helianthus annuus]|uniref:probable receptor-like protein kinase At2g23200 isoform X3 n=1 Tax=Helianthus annuus TaxID=4232 RepID=UPI001652E09E|nr:probable receptor-like protein kinase At2g23200 isoform X3 [Helianthus annuus]
MLSVVTINDEEKLRSLATESVFHRFSLAEIQSATQNFDDDLVVGKGGFGKVYKGCIYGIGDTTERVVAIKRLDSFSRQGASEFMTEIEMLSKLRHCHLVSLIGYCSDNNEMILVYEYMPNGTIEHHLHKAETPLSWMHRLKISIGAARGLDYLHTGVGTQQGIIHRDVKSSNILLDENWAAKIADFGLSKIIDEPSSGVSTGLKGTFGYLDPEYSMTGHLTRKSDVYSFGVVLFEVLSGRRAVDTRFKEEEWNLAIWAKKCVKERRLDQIVSSHIIAQISPKCLNKFVQIADRCLNNSRKKRPTMADVVVTLQQSLALQEQFDSSAQAAGSTGFTYKMQYLLFGPRHNSGDPDTLSSTHKGGIDHSFRMFSYRDMERATRNFSSHMLLGRGHYGEVYRGWLDKKTFSPSTSDNGLIIAVKRLDTYKFKPHMQKMKLLEEFNDPNVVKILGYCTEEDSILIVYEFMHQGTLNDYLFSVERRTERHLFISRVKIAIGVARGLAFLRTHPQLEDCSLQMHNILLDEEFNAKLSDFDVKMLVPSSDADEPLYLTPSSSYYLKVKSGVFGFGVLLMELLTGEPIASASDLAETRHCLPGEHGFVSLPSIYGALDCRIRLNFPQTKPAVQLALLAQKCVVDKSYLRPTLESVLQELEEIFRVMLNIGNSGN